jgi:hypothetical protein
MREVFFLIGNENEVLWSDASESPVHLPDSRARWEAIWSRREAIVEIAHSHPVGPLAFSREDETTMDALTSGLGRTLIYSVVAPRGMVRRNGNKQEIVHGPEPEWAYRLREASGMLTNKRLQPANSVAGPIRADRS